MYAVWVRKNFPNAKDVKLLWHMLRFDGKESLVISSRRPDQLDELVKNIVACIKKIESAEEFPLGDKPHCDYCTYQTICPKFTPKRVLNSEDGVKLVDELVSKYQEKRNIEKDIEQLKETLIELSKLDHSEVIVGTTHEIPIEKYPIADKDKSDWVTFRKLVVEKGLSEDYLILNSRKIGTELKKGQLIPELLQCLTVEEKVTVGDKRKIRKIDDCDV